jgi:hypothetical protein
MANRTPRSDPQSLTGVASGSLGTGTALDDTQRYSVDELGTRDELDHDAVPAPEDAEPVRSAASSTAGGPAVPSAPIGRSEPVVPPPASSAPAARAAVVLPAATAAGPVLTPDPRARTRGATGGYPVRPLAVAAIVLVVAAAALALRDGGLVGGTGSGGFAGADSFPPAPSAGVVVTPAPKPAPTGHGNGRGNGNGRGQH